MNSKVEELQHLNVEETGNLPNEKYKQSCEVFALQVKRKEFKEGLQTWLSVCLSASRRKLGVCNSLYIILKTEKESYML